MCYFQVLHFCFISGVNEMIVKKANRVNSCQIKTNLLEVRVHRPELKHKWAILIAEHNFLGKAPQFRDDNYVDSRNYKQRTVKPSCGTMSHMESPIIIKITTSHRVMPPDLGILGSLSCKDRPPLIFILNYFQQQKSSA